MELSAAASRALRRALAFVLVAAAAYAVPAIASAAPKQFGNATPGGSWGCPPADYKYGNRYTLAESGSVTSIMAYMRGAGVAGSQKFTAMIYAADGADGGPGTLLATSQEETVAGDAPAGAVAFPVSPAVTLPAGDYWIAQLSGPASGVACLSGAGSGLNDFNTNPYGDGPSDPFDGSAPILSDTNVWTLWATYDPVSTAPATITGSRVPPANAAGWTNQNVVVSFTCADPSDSSPQVTAPVTLSSEGAGQSVTGVCSDRVGQSVSTTVGGINIDKTAPVVSYAGNAGTYSVDQTVAIGCKATDALSGVASSTCAPISGPAYSFGPGQHSFSATATDNAGNTGNASTAFTVVVTPQSLCTLTSQLVEGSARYQSLSPRFRVAVDLLGRSACRVVDAVSPRLNGRQKAAAVAGYRLVVFALDRGGWLGNDQARALDGLAGAL